MTRAFLALLVFALPLSAAPVPKAVKAKASAPPLTGTKWSGTNEDTTLGTVEYEFREGGELAYAKRGAAMRVNGTWKQDGDTLTWSVNNGYATYTCEFKDGAFEGTAVNKPGKTWQVKLTPTEKK